MNEYQSDLILSVMDHMDAESRQTALKRITRRYMKDLATMKGKGLVGDSIIDAFFSLFEESPSNETTVCPVCKNDKARIVFSCPCGTKIDLCAACALDDHTWMEAHRLECEQFTSLVNLSREAR